MTPNTGDIFLRELPQADVPALQTVQVPTGGPARPGADVGGGRGVSGRWLGGAYEFAG
jgi:hypothetical protein